MRNLSGRGILLLHRRADGCGKLLDLLHAIGNPPDRFDRRAGGGLNGGDLAGNLFGRLRLCTASDFTSDATTANPRPASPARAASMVALRARRLVCLATSWMSLTTSPIFCAACTSPPTWTLVAPASLTAAPTRLLVWPSCRLISVIDEDNSSAASAAFSTLTEASFDA
jgi:hypothetical protein